MPTYDIDQVRATAIELQEKTLTLYSAVQPIFAATNDWTLNNVDALVPTPYDVKVQLLAYRALKIDALKLTDWITLLLQAQVGDTLAGGQISGLIPRTGSAILFWGAAENIPAGWLPMDGSTLGDASSGADYANAAAADLFALLWARYPNTDLPILDSTGAADTRGATATDDFNAQKRLPLPNWADQVDIFPGPGIGSVGCIVIIKL
jgi:hypothetical protein